MKQTVNMHAAAIIVCTVTEFLLSVCFFVFCLSAQGQHSLMHAAIVNNDGALMTTLIKHTRSTNILSFL